MKRCFKCGERKPKKGFYQHPEMGDGTLGKCIDCTKKDVNDNRAIRKHYYKGYDRRRWRKSKRRRTAHRGIAREWKKRNPEKVRDYWYRHKYGITLQQYEKMLAMGNGACWLCEKPPKTKRLAVEHSHRAPDRGRVRGLTCWTCNRMLIGRHTVETAKKLLAYLESSFDGRSL